MRMVISYRNSVDCHNADRECGKRDLQEAAVRCAVLLVSETRLVVLIP